MLLPFDCLVSMLFGFLMNRLLDLLVLSLFDCTFECCLAIDESVARSVSSF